VRWGLFGPERKGVREGVRIEGEGDGNIPSVAMASRNMCCASTYERECTKVNQLSPEMAEAPTSTSDRRSMLSPCFTSWIGGHVGSGLARSARDRMLDEWWGLLLRTPSVGGRGKESIYRDKGTMSGTWSLGLENTYHSPAEHAPKFGIRVEPFALDRQERAKG
jgi:hypothetical protein